MINIVNIVHAKVKKTSSRIKQIDIHEGVLSTRMVGNPDPEEVDLLQYEIDMLVDERVSLRGCQA